VQERAVALSFQETLAAWKARGWQQVNPVRFACLEALARRAHQHQGAARQLIDNKLSSLLAEYENSVPVAVSVSPESKPSTSPPSPSALLALLDHVAAKRSSSQDGSSRAGSAAGAACAVELESLTHLRATWHKLSAQQRLKRALAAAPHQAGPLNSQQLVHRCLSLMQETAPLYLHNLISTLDALSWAAQLHGGAAPVDSAAAPVGPRRKTKQVQKRGQSA
jgi:Protein of unknown function (DUF2894)